jgi:hypothetical protein
MIRIDRMPSIRVGAPARRQTSTLAHRRNTPLTTTRALET